MKNRFTLFIGLLVIVLLLAYMFMFQVRYDEWAVVSTFGKVTKSRYEQKEGLHFKWPWPIQKVTKYPKLVQIMDGELEEVATRDNHVVIIKTYLAWKITDPLVFFKEWVSIEDAQSKLVPIVRDIWRVFSRYDFNDMVNPVPKKVKLATMEQEATEMLRKELGEQTQGEGLTIVHLGIRRIRVPEAVTESVFERMTQERQTLAQGAKTSGEAEARAITEDAKQISEQILSFAESVASEIRLEGEIEATQYFDAFKEDPKLASFLRWTESLERLLDHRTTFVLSTEDILSHKSLLGARKHALQDLAPEDHRRAERQSYE